MQRLSFAWRLPAQRLRPPRRPVREHMAVFMAGMPGSGKSKVIDGRYGLARASTLLLDLDAEIIHHPLYDPDDPKSVYACAGAYRWADERVEEKFQAALQERCLYRRIVMDGTGTKVERSVQRMDDARAAGWFVKLLHVDVTLETAIARNAKRKRRVPEDVLAQYARRIAASVRVEAAHVDEVEVFDNNADDGLVGRQRWGKQYAKLMQGEPRLSALLLDPRQAGGDELDDGTPTLWPIHGLPRAP